jgi:hypothetical protein
MGAMVCYANLATAFYSVVDFSARRQGLPEASIDASLLGDSTDDNGTTVGEQETASRDGHMPFVGAYRQT